MDGRAVQGELRQDGARQTSGASLQDLPDKVATDQPDQIAAIARGGMDVIPRIEFMGQGIQGVVERTAIEAWPVAHRGHIRYGRRQRSGRPACWRRLRRQQSQSRRGAARLHGTRIWRRVGPETKPLRSFVGGARVDIMPVKNSAAATFRRFVADRRCTSPPSARSASGISALDPHAQSNRKSFRDCASGHARSRARRAQPDSVFRRAEASPAAPAASLRRRPSRHPTSVDPVQLFEPHDVDQDFGLGPGGCSTSPSATGRPP